MISVLILTLDEEVNLPACLESVKWSDDITVLDDGSSDKTVEIARRAGARVVVHSAGNELAQRMFSIREIPFKHEWVYNPDADEVTTPELSEEMMSAVSGKPSTEVAYRVRFKTIFKGKWVRHSSLYPTWVMRLFRPEKIVLERATNLRYVADGPVGFLQSHFIHNTFNKGMDAWWEKHRMYAAAEAVENVKLLEEGTVDVRGLFSLSDPVRRRRALKELSFRLPMRPQLRFAYMYLLRLGFLDGVAGLEYCRLMSRYEAEIVKEIGRLRGSNASAKNRQNMKDPS